MLRSDNGDTWKEHQFDIRPEDLTELLAGMDEGESLSCTPESSHQQRRECLKATAELHQTPALNVSLSELDSPAELEKKRICRIVTTDFPQYFAVVSRIKQDSNHMGPDGGMLSSSTVPMVQASFPQGALTKRIRVGLQVEQTQLGSCFGLDKPAHTQSFIIPDLFFFG